MESFNFIRTRIGTMDLIEDENENEEEDEKRMQSKASAVRLTSAAATGNLLRELSAVKATGRA